MVRTVGLFWIVAQPSMQWPQSCRGSFFGCSSLEWLVQWYPRYKWFWRTILLALGLYYHKVSGGRSLGLWHDQVALVVLDSTGFGFWVLVTLGTSTFNQIINMIKESEIDELSVSLNGSRIARLLACQLAGLSIHRKTVTNQTVDQPTWMRWSKQQRMKKWTLFHPK